MNAISGSRVGGGLPPLRPFQNRDSRGSVCQQRLARPINHEKAEESDPAPPKYARSCAPGATSKTTLFSPQDYAEIEVVLDDNGEVSRLDWTTGGNTYPMPKVVAPRTE